MLMQRIALAAIAMLGGAAALYAATVKGSVTDAAGEPLINASVRLLKPDSTFIRGVVTDFDGLYALSSVAPGRYIIESEYTGYAPAWRDIKVDSAMTALTVPVIKLAERSHLLNEVSVVAVKTQVKVKEDTVEYNADSYQTRPNAVVEDLIKRLPGVEVSSDGKITANGTQVSKILLDGKEFFGDDPTVASKNLPVDIVDKLQILNRKSDLARLTGVDDGEDETVINLTVKKGKNNGWLGNAEAGYGTDGRYKGNFTLNRLMNGNQITLLGNANNVNDAGFNDGNGGRFRGYGADNGINVTQSLGLNFNLGSSDERIRVGGNVFYSHSDREITSSTDRTYLLAAETSSALMGSRSRNKAHNLRADFRVLWKPDSFNTVELRPRISYNKINTLSMDSTLMMGDAGLLSRTFNDDSSDGHSLEASLRLIYSHNFRNHPGRSFSVHAQASHSDTRQNGDSYSLSTIYDATADDELTDQLDDNHTWNNAVNGRLTWTEPLGAAKNGNFLTLAYSLNYRWNNADRLTDLFDPATGEYTFSDRLSNRFRNEYFNQDIRVGFKRITKLYTLDAGVSAVPQSSSSDNLIDAARNIPTRHTFNFAPYLRYRHKWSTSRTLNVNYFSRSTQPSMTQLQPVADESDPMNVIIGNPLLDPGFRHDLRVRFQDYNAEHQRSIMTMAMATVEQNSVVSRTLFDTTTGARTTTYENVNGQWQARLMNMFSQPLGASKLWLFTSHVMLGYNHSVGFNNGVRNNSGNFSLNLRPSIAFRPKDIDLELRPVYSLQVTSNSLANVADMTVHSYGADFNASWYTPIGLVLDSELQYRGTSGYARGYDENTWMWNASVSYQFLRDKSLTVGVKAYDILGQKSSVSRNVTANYIDDSRYNTLTRYVMATVSFTFNTFGKGNEPKSDGYSPWGPGHGGPMGPPPGAPRR